MLQNSQSGINLRSLRESYSARYPCIDAAENGDLEYLKKLRDSGYKFNDWATTVAAENGHLDCLKFLYDNIGRFNTLVCYRAAENGQLECLKFAAENSANKSEWKPYANAARNGHLDCLRYMHEAGFDASNNAWMEAVDKNKDDCLQFIYENSNDRTRQLMHEYINNKIPVFV